MLPEAGPSASSPAPGAATSAPVRTPPAARTVTAYYVLLDDGGRNGVRFGCNDSLVGVDRAEQGTAEPLAAAIGALLGGEAASATGAETGMEPYNALADSRLTFLSGTFDGTTVTVYLAGTLTVGGVCDAPRVEAQLTQTAVAAMGAIRAEVFVNGQSLTEALRQDP